MAARTTLDQPARRSAQAEPAHVGTRRLPAETWDAGATSKVVEAIAEEVPVALVYNGISHAVMLATPADLEDFATGFSLSEGIVDRVADIRDVEVVTVDHGLAVEVNIGTEQFVKLKARRRNLAGRTGCGLCGTESLDQVFRDIAPVRSDLAVSPERLHDAADRLAAAQPLHASTGSIHAAAWSDPEGKLLLVREDIGRHNALDKLIGAMAIRHIGFADGFVLLTSRASSEMVQKAAAVGIPLVAAISAPTSLAIELAERSGVTLVGFMRKQRHTVYSHPERLVVTAAELAR